MPLRGILLSFLYGFASARFYAAHTAGRLRGCGGYNVGDTKRKSRGRGSCRGSLGGGYLLSRFRSIIGVAGLNFSVRDG